MHDDKHPDFPLVPAEEQIEEAVRHAESLRAGDVKGSKPAFMPKTPLADFEGDDDDVEFGEPDEHLLHEPDNIAGVKPMIASLVFTGTDKEGDFAQVVQALISQAEQSGLFYLSAFVNELDEEHVVPGSPLHQQLTGRMA